MNDKFLAAIIAILENPSLPNHAVITVTIRDETNLTEYQIKFTKRALMKVAGEYYPIGDVKEEFKNELQ